MEVVRLPLPRYGPDDPLTISDTTDVNTVQGTALHGLSVTLVDDQNPPAAPPAADLPAPSGLTARLVPGKSVQLPWPENSTDENAFAVGRRTPTTDWARVAPDRVCGKILRRAWERKTMPPTPPDSATCAPRPSVL